MVGEVEEEFDCVGLGGIRMTEESAGCHDKEATLARCYSALDREVCGSGRGEGGVF